MWVFFFNPTMNPSQWLKPYIPVPVLRAADVLADHVDFWEEEAFRVSETGKWRDRELTNFIRSGYTADRNRLPRFKQLLAEYIELSMQHSPSKVEAEPRKKALSVAMAEIKKWLRTITPSSPPQTRQIQPPPTHPAYPPAQSHPVAPQIAPFPPLT